MSHAGLAIVIVAAGAFIGLKRGRVSDGRALAISLVIASAAVSFHVLEMFL